MRAGLAIGSIVLNKPPKALIKVLISSSGGAEGDNESKPKAIAKRLFEDALGSMTRTAALLVDTQLSHSPFERQRMSSRCHRKKYRVLIQERCSRGDWGG